MKRVTRFGAFWYDFIIGDDWRIALGVVAAVSVVFVAAHHGENWWWLLPVVVASALTISVVHAARTR